jgi:hypothetical protein
VILKHNSDRDTRDRVTIGLTLADFLNFLYRKVHLRGINLRCAFLSVRLAMEKEDQDYG